MVSRHRFPETFRWGVATSAYQIEGSPCADGATASIWHDFAHAKGNTLDGHHGDVACDHYRRFREDVEQMRPLGVSTYRFSFGWPRVMPDWGVVNPAGIDFYSRLIDALLENGIQPYATMYHWDLPRFLQHASGWLNPASRNWFADYAGTLFRQLGDRVEHWVTINEPWVIANHGYLEGVHPPGETQAELLPIVIHHLLMAHHKAVGEYRASGHGEIGIALNMTPHHPASNDVADVWAADRCNCYVNELFLQSVLKGSYPQAANAIFGSAFEERQSELASAFESIDFLGVNYYFRAVVPHEPEQPVTQAVEVRSSDVVRTEMGWEVDPNGLTDVLCDITSRLGPVPIYITENGAAFVDRECLPDGSIVDQDRWNYLQGHICAAAKALERGVSLRGYFVWSLLDNFEWQFGYSKRFGIVGVDPNDQKRRLKWSGQRYRDFLTSDEGEF